MDWKNKVDQILPVWGPPLVLAGVLVALLLIVGVWYGNRREVPVQSDASSVEVADGILTSDLDAYVKKVAEEQGLNPDDVPGAKELLQQMPNRGSQPLADEALVKQLLRAHISQIAQDRVQGPASSSPAAGGAAGTPGTNDAQPR